MRRTVKVKLLPDPAQAAALIATMELTNHAATQAAEVVFAQDLRRTWHIQQVVYGQLKEAGLTAQMAVRVCTNLARAQKAARARHRLDRPVHYRARAAITYDDRLLRWHHDRQTVSIWVADRGDHTPGRIQVRYTGHPDHLAVLAARQQGQSHLIVDRQGRLYLSAGVELPEPAPVQPSGWLGVDLGIVQIATVATEAGDAVADWSGGAVTARRQRNASMRARLQQKGTKSAKRLLKKRSRKESRFAADVNHQISKRIVAEAERTGAGIAIEDLRGIRQRVRHRKPQRAIFHSWAFAQLRTFLSYKAENRGVPLVAVDPAHTSQQCSRCGNSARRNRPDQAHFRCRECGHTANADHNAAVNIARRGKASWAGAGLPDADQHQAGTASPPGQPAT